MRNFSLLYQFTNWVYACIGASIMYMSISTSPSFSPLYHLFLSLLFISSILIILSFTEIVSLIGHLCKTRVRRSDERQVD